MKLINEAEVLSKWRPIVTEATGLDLDENKQKVDWISEYCHFHDMNQSINEAATLGNTLGMGNVKLPTHNGTQATSTEDGSGDRPVNTLAISMQVAAQTVGFDLVPVVTMDGAITILTYADAVYGGGDVDTEDTPVIVSIDGITVASGAAEGDTFDVYDATGGSGGTGSILATFEYLGLSRINRTPIVRVVSLANGATTLADVADNGVSVEGDAVDNGDATVSFELVNALENHITGFSGADWLSNDPYTRGEGETAQSRTMGLSLYSKTVEAETFQVDASLTWEQVQDIPRDHGWDPVGQLETVLLNELSQSINKYILQRLFSLGLEHVNQNTTGLESFAFDTSATRKYDEKRRLYGRVLAVANYIATRGRRGPASFVVTNARLGSIMQDVKGFTNAPMTNTINQETGSLYPLGTISNLTIYVDPLMTWDDDRVLIGRKGDGNSPGLVFMPYLMADSIQITAEGTMAPKIAVKSRFALVDAGHHPETMYYVVEVTDAASFV